MNDDGASSAPDPRTETSTRAPADPGAGPGTLRDITVGAGFVEVADRVWVARHDPVGLSLGLVAGDAGLLVVDTHSSRALGQAVIEMVRALGVGDVPVTAVVNTHAHWDHVLGNAAFLEAYDAPAILAHEEAAATLRDRPEEVLADAARRTDVEGTAVVVPTDPFSSARVVDLGGRIVEVVHPGRGHTGGDAVVRVPDADVVFAGDLVEESGPPAFGEDCWPLEWPATLDLLAGLTGPGTVVVPGHGNPVDQGFVLEQRGSIGIVAETIRELAAGGRRPEDMAAATSWPYPAEDLGHAFRRGFEQLPRAGRSLPLA